jgi:hypothetical protein
LRPKLLPGYVDFKINWSLLLLHASNTPLQHIQIENCDGKANELNGMAHILCKKFFHVRSQNWYTTSPIGLKIWTILPNRNFELAASWIAVNFLQTTWGECNFGEGQLRGVATLESGNLRSVVRWDTQLWSRGNPTSGGRVSTRIPCGSKFWLDPSKLTGCRV